jgi:hypothetical protein
MPSHFLFSFIGFSHNPVFCFLENLVGSGFGFGFRLGLRLLIFSFSILVLTQGRFLQSVPREREEIPTSHGQAGCQRTVFNCARSQLHCIVAWMGNFDVDEFLWTPQSISPLTQLLQSTYAGFDKIDIIAIVFRNSNFSEPVNRPVIEASPTALPIAPTFPLLRQNHGLFLCVPAVTAEIQQPSLRRRRERQHRRHILCSDRTGRYNQNCCLPVEGAAVIAT